MKSQKEGISTARNIGVLSTNCEIICFLDSDCVADKHWIEEFAKAWEKSGSKVGGIRGRVLPKTKDFLTNFLSSGLYIAELQRGVTDNLSYKKEVLIQAGLFDPELKINEDADLARRVLELGYIIQYNDSALVFHDYSFSAKRFIKREIKFGRGSYMLWRKTHDVKAITHVIFGLSGLFFLLLALLVSLAAFFIVLVIFLFSATTFYRKYIIYFLRENSPFYLPILFCIYILKNLCNLIGFLFQFACAVKLI